MVPFLYATCKAMCMSYTSEAQRKRVVATKFKPHHKLGTMYIKDKLCFAERARRPVRKGNILMMVDELLPITAYAEDDCYWIPNNNRIQKLSENLERLLAVTNREQAESEQRETEIFDSFESDLRYAEKEVKTFDMGH